MKIGRNEPCFCGSGKKYKKCCLEEISKDLLEELGDLGELRKYVDEMVAEFAEKEDAAVELYQLTQQVRMDQLGGKPHIKAYKYGRGLHQEIIDAMVDYCYEKDFFSRYPEEIEQLELVFDREISLGSNAFFDTIIYKYPSQAVCLTETFLDERRVRATDKIKLLRQMLDSTIGLFHVSEINYEEARVTLKHVFTGQEFSIVDFGLSSNPEFVSNYIYLRVISYGEISFGTGFSMFFVQDDPFIQEFIQREQENYRNTDEFNRLVTLYNYRSKEDGGIRVFRNNPLE